MRRTLLLATAIAIPAFAAGPRQDYDQLQKWQFTTAAISISEPVTLKRDTATWTLKSGSLRLMQPLPGGKITGLVFEGDGRFTMTVPDRVELAQLRRFASKPDMQSIDTAFSELVFRTSEGSIDRLFAGRATGPFSPNGAATARHNHWLIDRRLDVDAAIVAAMANEGAVAIAAATRSTDFGWLHYDYDGGRPEAVQLVRYFRDYPEVWLSLESDAPRLARLDAIDVRADLTRYSFKPTAGETHQRKLNGRYVVEETLTALTDGVSALRMQLHPIAREVTARDEQGAALDVIRDHIGGRSANVENKFHDPVLTIFFPAPMAKGAQRRVTFEYELETENFALGRSWYPTFPGFFDLHTARLDFLVNPRNAVRSMGTQTEDGETDKGKRSVWIIARPTMMVTFSTAERFEEATVELPGVPPITSFGAVARINPASRVRKAAEDVAGAVDFFQTFLGYKLDTPRLFVTSITGEHGQAFDGFLHLSERSYMNEPGAEELFRAHETAHAWFGHTLAWKSYRDQWLTESIAEYLAMMYVEARVKDGPRLFEQILDSYEGIVKGNWAGGFSKFNRPWLVNAMRNASYRSRIGPIAHGFRAGTGDMPFGYMVQAYYKGPLVMHMLRTLLRYQTGNDDAFRRVLGTFVRENAGKQVSTADFQRVVEKTAGGDWSWFFETWVYSAELPAIRWSSSVQRSAQQWRVAITVKRTSGAETPSFTAPVRIALANGSMKTMLVTVDGEEHTVSELFDSEPRRVLFAPDHSLLSSVGR